MKLSIHQPSYWPWLGLLSKIARSDHYIILDDVPANKASYQYRNQFFCNGKEKIITLPVNYHSDTPINQLMFSNNKWKEDHLNKIKNYYLKAPYLNEFISDIEEIYMNYNDIYVFPFVLEIMKYVFNILDINTEISKSSQYNSKLSKGELVLDLCIKSGADIYISGTGAKKLYVG